MQTSTKSSLLTTKEAAEFLGVSAGTLAVWRCVARYRLPFVKIGRCVRYDEADLREWLDSRKVGEVVVGGQQSAARRLISLVA